LMPVHPLTPFPWEPQGPQALASPDVGVHSSTHDLGDGGPWPSSMWPAHGPSLHCLDPLAHSQGSCWAFSSARPSHGALTSLLQGAKLAILPGLFAYTSLSERRRRGMTAFLSGLFIAFSTGFILLQSSFGLWGAGSFK